MNPEKLRQLATETLNLLTAQGELEERVRKNKKKLVDFWHEVDDALDGKAQSNDAVSDD